MKIKLWEPTGGYWLVWTGVVYVILGMINLFYLPFIEPVFLQMIWLFIISLPLWIKPIAKWLNMRSFWDAE